MAWTLHPALLYEKYGTVLVQLWDSGAMGTLFRPVRRLSRSIGEAITARRRGSGGTIPAVQDPEALQVTDDSIPTSDEAQCRAYFIPGDTTSSPSSSEENELAFQGDLYTQMRRSRRQSERIKKIRQARQQFLESSSSCSGSVRRRRSRRRGAKSSKMRDLFRRDGTGTPLTEMEGPTEQPRVLIIDAPDTSSPASPCSELNEDAEGGSPDVGTGRGKGLGAARLARDNDSLRKFRAISGRRKASVSPPPGVVSDKSETASDIDLSAQSGHAITADELLPGDSLHMFESKQGQKKRISPSATANSSVQPELTMERPQDGFLSGMMIADELNPDNDSLNEFRTTQADTKSACSAASEASGQPASMIDLHRGRALSIAPSELLPDNDSLQKSTVAHTEKATSPPQFAGVANQSESQTESQRIIAEATGASVTEAYVDDRRGGTVTEGKSRQAADQKTKRSTLCKAPAEDTSKDGSALSKQMSPTDEHVPNLLPSRDEVSTSLLRGARKKTKGTDGDRVEAKKARRKRKGKSKLSVDGQKSLDHTSGLETSRGETPSATNSDVTPRSSSVMSPKAKSKKTRTQREGQNMKGKRGQKATDTRGSSKEGAEKDAALPFSEAYAPIGPALGTVDASTSGTAGVQAETTGPDLSSTGYTEIEEKKRRSVETSPDTETGKLPEDSQTTRTTEDVATSELAVPTGNEVHESENLRPATSTKEIAGKHRRKAKWGKRDTKRHMKQQKRPTPVSPSSEKSQATQRPSVPDGTAIDGSLLTPSSLSVASYSEGTPNRRSRRHRSKRHANKDREGRKSKASKDKGKKAETYDATSTSRGAGADGVSSETTEEAKGSRAALISPSTIPASGILSESVARDTARSVQMESGRRLASSTSVAPVLTATTVTSGPADSGSTSRDKPQQNMATPQGKDATRLSEEGPSRRSNRLTLWPFRRKP